MKVWILLTTCLAIQIRQCLSCIHSGIACIDYEEITWGAERERQYPATEWISAKAIGPSLSRAQINLYEKLFNYTQEDSNLKEFINKTTPTRTKVIPCNGEAWCESTFIMSFLIPKDVYDDMAPIPTDADIFFEREPPTRYVTRKFGDATIPSETKWITEAQKLADLTVKDVGVARDHYYLYWYDPQHKDFIRINEVWLTKSIKKKSSDPKKLIRDQNDPDEVC